MWTTLQTRSVRSERFRDFLWDDSSQSADCFLILTPGRQLAGKFCQQTIILKSEVFFYFNCVAVTGDSVVKVDYINRVKYCFTEILNVSQILRFICLEIRSKRLNHWKLTDINETFDISEMADVDGRPDPTQLPSRNLALRIPDNPPVSPSSSSQQDQRLSGAAPWRRKLKPI